MIFKNFLSERFSKFKGSQSPLNNVSVINNNARKSERLFLSPNNRLANFVIRMRIRSYFFQTVCIKNSNRCIWNIWVYFVLFNNSSCKKRTFKSISSTLGCWNITVSSSLVRMCWFVNQKGYICCKTILCNKVTLDV